MKLGGKAKLWQVLGITSCELRGFIAIKRDKRNNSGVHASLEAHQAWGQRVYMLKPYTLDPKP